MTYAGQLGPAVTALGGGRLLATVLDNKLATYLLGVKFGSLLHFASMQDSVPGVLMIFVLFDLVLYDLRRLYVTLCTIVSV
jgi:hypothetical protein